MCLFFLGRPPKQKRVLEFQGLGMFERKFIFRIYTLWVCVSIKGCLENEMKWCALVMSILRLKIQNCSSSFFWLNLFFVLCIKQYLLKIISTQEIAFSTSFIIYKFEFIKKSSSPIKFYEIGWALKICKAPINVFFFLGKGTYSTADFI